MKVYILCLLLCIVAANAEQVANSSRSFTVGYNDNCFLKDGKCFRYVSGSMHYFRVPKVYWKDRMLKLKAAGLNALQTYIEWNSHESEPGVFDFSGNLDIVEYIQMAADTGLLVIIRPGPYIDSERDMGGLPYWLLGMDSSMVLRTIDPTYMFYVERYLAKLLPLLKPLMYHNGGPIISVQVENEYGSYFACDRDYTARLRYLFEETLGMETLFFTTDGNADYYITCGQVDGAYATVDFGPGADLKTAFKPQRNREPRGPLVNSEYYPGWIDHWSQPHSLVSSETVAETLDEMLAMNASVNIYIFHGGTSFGLTSGANLDPGRYQPNPTSYDFDAPVSESGDLTNKFMKLREVIGKYLPLPSGPLPKNSTKMSFGPVLLTPKYSLTSVVDLQKYYQSSSPMTFEEMGVNQGFVFYETRVDFRTTDPVMLNIPGLKDRGYVFVDRVFKGIIGRGENIYSIPIVIQPGQNLSVLVENQGRVCYGSGINDSKGILGNVTLANRVLYNWTMYLLPVPNKIKSELFVNNGLHEPKFTALPGVFVSEFVLETDLQPADTFLKLDGWYKGIAILNGIVLGRYWPVVGPQSTLYVPGVFLKPSPDKNVLLILELEGAPCSSTGPACKVYFDDTPDINSPTPVGVELMLKKTQNDIQNSITK